MPSHVVGQNKFRKVDKSCCLSGYVSPDGRTSDGMPLRAQKAWLALSIQSNMWDQRDMRLLIKGRVYTEAVI